MAQTFGFMLYVLGLGLGLVACVLGLGLAISVLDSITGPQAKLRQLHNDLRPANHYT